MTLPKLHRSYSLACSDYLGEEVIRINKGYSKSEFGYWKAKKLWFIPWFPKWVPVLMIHQMTFNTTYYFLDDSLRKYFLDNFAFSSNDKLALTNYFDYN
jgi:hypothetical protein